MPHLALLDSVRIRRAGDRAVIEYLDDPVRITVRLTAAARHLSDQDVLDRCNRRLLALAEAAEAAPALAWDEAGGCWRPLRRADPQAVLWILIDLADD
jgi:hypothetical protein